MDTQIIIYGIVNAGLAFVEGAALIVSPCILPILPIVLSSSIEGGNRRSWGIICGFVLIFALFTLFSRALVQYLGVNLDLLRKIAYLMIIVFGVILYSDTLSDKFSVYTQKIATLGDNVATPNPKAHFWSGLVLGTAISLIWVPCGGPILAAAIVQSAVQHTNWQSFKNQYWPAHYLIDKNGIVVYEHFGEGQYDTTEHNIVALLGVKEKPNASDYHESSLSFNFSQTPETYLGYARSRSYSGQEATARDTAMNYDFPSSIPQDGWALQGKWLVNSDKIVAQESGAQLKLHFYSKKVYIVMGSENNKPMSVKVLLNDKPIDSVNITRPMLYEVVHLQTADSVILTLIPESAGLEFFAFTFGN